MQEVLRIEGLPADALDAASAFHRLHLAEVRDALARSAESVVVLLPAAGHDHAGWRRALVQDLARAHVPVRINFVAGDDREAGERTAQWLAGAPGVTGQLLHTD
jgi:hypothetical protein